MPNKPLILSVLAVLDGGAVEPETRVECPLPIDPGQDADVVIVAKIRKGHVRLKWHYLAGLNQPALREGRFNG